MSLKKTAFLENLLTTVAGHAAQNLAAEKQLLNEKGGREFVRQLLGVNKSKFLDGLGNAFVPEKGILVDEARDVVKELPNMKLKTKALLHRMSTGNLDRKTVEKILQNKALRIVLGPRINELLSKIKNLPDEALGELKQVHLNNGIGRFAKGAAEELRHIDKKTLSRALKNNSKEGVIGEIAGNAALGAIEPLMPVVNGTKRLLAAKIKKPENKALQKVWGMHNKLQQISNEKFVKKPLKESYEFGKQGKKIGFIYGHGNNAFEKLINGKLVDRYFFNRPLSELNEYANKVGLLANKYKVST